MRTSRLEYRLVAAMLGLALVPAASLVKADDCPTSTFSTFQSSEEFAGPNGDGFHDFGGFAISYFTFQGYGDTTRVVAGSGGSGTLTARGRYRFLGPPPGTLVGIVVQLRIRGSMFGHAGPDCLGGSAQSHLLHDDVPVVGGQWSSQPGTPPNDDCGAVVSGDYAFDCIHPAGTPFELSPRTSVVSSSGSFAGTQVTTKLTFGYLPPGTFLVRCDGDTAVQVVGVEPEIAGGLRIASIRPNPARGEFRVSLSVPEGGPAFVRLLDLTGRVVESRVWDASRAESRELTFGQRLAPGHYFLQVAQGATSVVRAVTIRR